MPEQVATANRLADGMVVYLTEADAWAEKIDDARVLRTDEDAAEGQQACDSSMADNAVVEALLIEVTTKDGKPWPVEYREVIRATGPSNRTDLGKQAE